MKETGRNSMTALEKARSVSQALADAARQARFSSRTRRNLSGGGFAARRGSEAYRLLAILGFWLIVAIPGSLGVAYFLWFASNQYQAEIQFTVAGGEPVMADGLTAITGIPSITIIQDTQIVTNFLHSRAAIEKMQAKLDMRGRYALKDIDFWAHFDAEKPIERFVKYWQKMTSVAIKLPGGIVHFRIRAFRPEDARDIARAALEVSEELINDLNQRQTQDALRNSEADVERAAKRLMESRIALEKARNEAGILDVGASVQLLGTLITEMRASALKMQLEYQAQLRVVSETAPQMRGLRTRIDTANAQITEMEARLTSTKQSAPGENTLALSMTRFAVLDLERKIAERLYAGAVSTMEVARLTSERKRMYLNTFVEPSLPQESQYPRRILSSFGVVGGLLALWGALLGLISMARNYMA